MNQETEYALDRQKARYENYLMRLIPCLEIKDAQPIKEDIQYVLKMLNIIPKEHEFKEE